MAVQPIWIEFVSCQKNIKFPPNEAGRYRFFNDIYAGSGNYSGFTLTTSWFG
jgi:hypothetical protein